MQDRNESKYEKNATYPEGDYRFNLAEMAWFRVSDENGTKYSRVFVNFASGAACGKGPIDDLILVPFVLNGAYNETLSDLTIIPETDAANWIQQFRFKSAQDVFEKLLEKAEPEAVKSLSK